MNMTILIIALYVWSTCLFGWRYYKLWRWRGLCNCTTWHDITAMSTCQFNSIQFNLFRVR